MERGHGVRAHVRKCSILCMHGFAGTGRSRGKVEGVNRLALGAHGKTPNEEVRGDMGWTSFEARGASSMIEYKERLRGMDKREGQVFRF